MLGARVRVDANRVRTMQMLWAIFGSPPDRIAVTIVLIARRHGRTVRAVQSRLHVMDPELLQASPVTK